MSGPGPGPGFFSLPRRRPRRLGPVIVTGFQRVGSEPLRPLPLFPSSDEPFRVFVRAHRTRIDKGVYEVLRQENFVTRDHYADARDEADPAKTQWEIVLRCSSGEDWNCTSYITVLITVPWDPNTGTSTWEGACLKLKRCIDNELENTGYNVLVEMISRQVAGPITYAPVTGREDLDRDWEQIKDTTRRILESDKSTFSAWNCIALFRLGLNKSAMDNPPTLYISIDRASPEQVWRVVASDLERYLGSCVHGLHLHIEHSAPQFMSIFELNRPENDIIEDDPLLTKEPYEERVFMGADLSASLYLELNPKTNFFEPKLQEHQGRLAAPVQRPAREGRGLPDLRQQPARRGERQQGRSQQPDWRSQGQQAQSQQAAQRGRGQPDQRQVARGRPTQSNPTRPLPQPSPTRGPTSQPTTARGAQTQPAPARGPPSQPTPAQTPSGQRTKKSSIIGTMGCYIEIANQSGKWKCFALTNYHVVRPAIPGFKLPAGAADCLPPEEGTELRQADLFGFKPGHNFQTPIESPSRNKHNKTVAYYRRLAELAPAQKEFAERRVKESVEFFDSGKHIFGYLFAGSGFAFRTADNGSLDWALIEVLPSRLGNNNLPSQSIWPMTLLNFLPPDNICGKPLRKPAPAHELGHEDKNVYKVSAITKATTGAFSAHLADSRLTNWGYMIDADICKRTSEHVFISRSPLYGPRFANRGDSGAVVYDGNARSLGLLFRGDANDGFHRPAYVTPLEHVLTHIAEFLGLKPNAIRIAQFPQ